MTMRKVVNVKSSSTIARRIATVLAILHLLAVVAFAVYLHQSNEGQAILLWTMWTPIDFPVSLLVPWGLEVLSSGSEWSSALRLALPYVVHGILGTIWWFCLPLMVAGLFRKIPGSQKNSPSV